MFCGNCGNKIDENDKFCGKCGAFTDDLVSDKSNNECINHYSDVEIFSNKINSKTIDIIIHLYFWLSVVSIVFCTKCLIELTTNFSLTFNMALFYIQDYIFYFIGNLRTAGDVSGMLSGLVSCYLVSFLIIMFYFCYKQFPKWSRGLAFQSLIIFILSVYYALGMISVIVDNIVNMTLLNKVGCIILSIISLVLKFILFLYLKKHSGSLLDKYDPRAESFRFKGSKIIMVASVVLIIASIFDILPVIVAFITYLNIFKAKIAVWSSIPISIVCFSAGFLGIKAANQKYWSLTLFSQSVPLALILIGMIITSLISVLKQINYSSSVSILGITINAFWVIIIFIMVVLIAAPVALSVQSWKKYNIEKNL